MEDMLDLGSYHFPDDVYVLIVDDGRWPPTLGTIGGHHGRHLFLYTDEESAEDAAELMPRVSFWRVSYGPDLIPALAQAIAAGVPYVAIDAIGDPPAGSWCAARDIIRAIQASPPA